MIAVSAADVVSLPSGQGWRQAGELALALVLSACVGVEREVRQKNAGLRTHALVGLGAALFMLVSKYGFSDVVVKGLIIADPSRMASAIPDGHGILRQLLQTTTAQGFTIGELSARSLPGQAEPRPGPGGVRPLVEQPGHRRRNA